MLRGDVLQHQEKQFQYLKVMTQVIRPTNYINIPKVYLRLLAHKRVILTIGAVKVIGECCYVYSSITFPANDRKRLLYVICDSAQC